MYIRIPLELLANHAQCRPADVFTTERHLWAVQYATAKSANNLYIHVTGALKASVPISSNFRITFTFTAYVNCKLHTCVCISAMYKHSIVGIWAILGFEETVQ